MSNEEKNMVYRTKIEEGGAKLLCRLGWNLRYARCRHRQAKIERGIIESTS